MLKKFLEVVYKRDGTIVTEDNNTLDRNVKATIVRFKNYRRTTVTLNVAEKIEFVSGKFFFQVDFKKDDKIFSNGFQSWTPSFEAPINFKEAPPKKITQMLTPFLHLNAYGDGNFYKYKNKEGVIHSNGYTYVKRENVYHFYGSLTEKNGFTIFETDVSQGTITVSLDAKGLELESREYVLFDLVEVAGTKDVVFDTYFEVMGVEKPTAKPLVGYSSWYNHFQDISEEKLESCLKGLEKEKIDIFQVDDGFEHFVGDWLEIHPKRFPSGVDNIFKKIKEKHMLGLWLAPFVAERKSQIFKKHKDWFLRDGKGRLVPCGHNWSGFYALDIYNDEVVAYLEKVFDHVFNVWGVDLVKLDFLYGAAVAQRKNKTRGEVMCYGMELLRRLCKNKLILGCGVNMNASFGLVDYMRVSCDVTLDWNDTKIMQMVHRERPSTKNAMMTTIARHHLSGRAFLNDPDVFFLRDDNIFLEEKEKECLEMVNSLFGKVLFTSDDFSKFSPEKREIFSLLAGNLDAEINEVESVSPLHHRLFFTLHGEKRIAYFNLSDETWDAFEKVESRSVKIV